jgi:hypothetical protein
MIQPYDTPLPTAYGDSRNRPLMEESNYVGLSGEPRQGFVPFGGEGRRLA